MSEQIVILKTDPEILRRLQRLETLLTGTESSQGVLAYSTEKAAQLLDVRPDVLNQWRRDGLIQGIKTGHSFIYERQELERFLRENRGKNRTRRQRDE